MNYNETLNKRVDEFFEIFGKRDGFGRRTGPKDGTGPRGETPACPVDDGNNPLEKIKNKLIEKKIDIEGLSLEELKQLYIKECENGVFKEEKQIVELSEDGSIIEDVSELASMLIDDCKISFTFQDAIEKNDIDVMKDTILILSTQDKYHIYETMMNDNEFWENVETKILNHFSQIDNTEVENEESMKAAVEPSYREDFNLLNEDVINIIDEIVMHKRTRTQRRKTKIRKKIARRGTNFKTLKAKPGFKRVKTGSHYVLQRMSSPEKVMRKRVGKALGKKSAMLKR